MDYDEIVRDFEKLSPILNAAEEQYPHHRLPRAFVGGFNNRTKPSFNFAHLQKRLDIAAIRPDVMLLGYDVLGPANWPSPRCRRQPAPTPSATEAMPKDSC